MDEPNQPRAQYQRLAEEIGDRISAGVYPVGTQLPSNRVLAEEFGASHMTIKQALTVLIGDGVIASRRGVRAEVLATPRSADQLSVIQRLATVESALEALSHRVAAIEDHEFDSTGRRPAGP